MRPWVWAPLAARVDIVIDPDGAEHRAVAVEIDGDRFASSVELGDGDLYAWSLDGGTARADPRSMFQPAGPMGPSMIVDHSRFEWTDRHRRSLALDGAVVYEVHIGTFTPQGTFLAAIDKLNRLGHLGVTAIELMPIVEQSFSRGWGYDPVNLFAPHHRYGTPDDLKHLVDAAHALGLGVIVDVVYNHFGPEHCSLLEFGPYTTSRHRTPWGDGVNLDGSGSEEIRSFIVDNCTMWLRDYHVDGLRLDATHELRDDSTQHILREVSAATAELGAVDGRRFVLIAEDDRHDPQLTAPLWEGGMGMDSQWADDLHHAIHVALTGERFGYYERFDGASDIAVALEQGFIRWPEGVAVDHSARDHPERFVVCLQNHDQIGNRAVGERIEELVGFDAAAAAAVIAVLNPFVTLLFQGEEWAASAPFCYFADPISAQLRDAISRGRAAEFPWWTGDVPDPVDVVTFERSVLDWSEAGSGRHREMVEWYRSLIALKASACAQRAGLTHVRREGSVVRWRFGPNDVAVNLSGVQHDVDWPDADGDVILGRHSRGRAGRMTLGPWGVAIRAMRW